MQLGIFLNAIFLSCFSLVQISSAGISTSYLPVRILGLNYPKEAKFARIQGIVEAKCIIRKDGSVADVNITSGHPVLARAIKANLLQWSFRSYGNENLLEEVKITCSFQLKGSCDQHRECKEQFWFEYPANIIIISELPEINEDANTKRGAALKTAK